MLKRKILHFIKTRFEKILRFLHIKHITLVLVNWCCLSATSAIYVITLTTHRESCKRVFEGKQYSSANHLNGNDSFNCMTFCVL